MQVSMIMSQSHITDNTWYNEEDTYVKAQTDKDTHI